MLSPAEAARLILEHLRPTDLTRVTLRDALDLVLGETVTSPVDLPPWDNSAMDGFACRATDVGDAAPERPAVLRVVETVPAGSFPDRAVGAGEAIRVFTGSPLPEGSDTVIRQEDTGNGPGGGDVAILSARDAGKNVRRRGEDVRRGQIVFDAGTALGPAELGVLASITHGEPLVHRRPRVAFLGSGDEIVDLDRRAEVLAGRKIASSNSYTLDALIRRSGAEPLDLGIATDSKDSLRRHLEPLETRGADLLVTTAGVSVGEHDLVREVLAERGCDLKLWRVRMRPGAPLAFGTFPERAWIGLPGNPVSTMVTFELFVRPAIRRLMGHRCPFRRLVSVRVAESVTLGPRLRHFLRAVVEENGAAEGGGGLVARLTGPQGSGILTSMVRANALLIVPEDAATVQAGAMLQALLLDDPHHVAAPPY
jgi:molybdopterin molybdotransferase